MADITKDDIFDKDLAEPLRELNNEFLKTLEMLKKTTIEADKTNASLKSKATDDNANATKKLADEQKKLIAVQKEQQKAVEALDKQRQKALQQIAKLEAEQRDLITASQMEAKTYDELSKKMGALNKLRKQQDITTEEGRKAYAAMSSQVMALNKQLTAMDEEIGVHSRKVGSYKEAIIAANMSMGEMKRTLRELRNVPLAGKTPEEIAQVEKQIAKLTGEIADYQARMRLSGDSTQLMIEGLQGIVAVAQGVTGALSAMGFNTEKLDKAMVQLIGVSQALATIHELNKKRMLQSVAAVIKDTYAKAANAVATKGMAMATEGATVATRAFGNAIKSVPFVAIAAAVVTLVAGAIALAKHLTEASTASRIMTDATEKASQSIGEQRGELQKYLIIARDTNRSYKERQDAINEINKISPEYLGNLNLENINTKAATDALNQYNVSIGRKARLIALQNILVEKYTELEKEKDLKRRIAIENEIEETEKLIQKQIDLADGKLFNRIDNKGGGDEFEGKEMVDFLTGNIWVYHNGKWVLKAELPKGGGGGGGGGGGTTPVKTALDELTDAIADVNEQYKLNIELTKNELDPKKQNIALMSAEIENVKGIYSAYEKYFQAGGFAQNELDSLRILNAKVKSLEEQKIAIEKLYDAQQKVSGEKPSEPTGMEGFTPRSEAIPDVAGGNTFSDYLGSFNDELTKFWTDYGETVTTVYNSIDTIIKNSLDKQLAQIEEQQKASDVYFADKMKAYEGDEAAQEELAAKQKQRNAEIEAERKRVARKQAVYERSKAIFEIGIATATAIIKQLATTPLPYGAPFIAAVAAAGAAQIAAALSKPLPQYYTGLDSAKDDHIGSVAERGRELMITPDGKATLFTKRQATFIPKNSTIYNNSDTEALLNRLIIDSVSASKNGTSEYDFDKLDRRLAEIDKTIRLKPVASLKSGYSLRDIDYIKKYDV